MIDGGGRGYSGALPLRVVRHGGVDGHHGSGGVQQAQVGVPATGNRHAFNNMLAMLTLLTAACRVDCGE